MKRFLTLMAILICGTAFAQKDPRSFSVTDDNTVIWQKIFDTDKGIEELYEDVINSGKLMDVVLLNDKITAKLVKNSVNFKALGYNRGQVPMYIGTGDFSAFITIQVKDNRYRVTIQDIIVTINKNIGLGERGEDTHLEEYVLNKRGQFNSSFLYDAVRILEDYFTSLCVFESKSYINNEW